jgi:hypothetical protein
MSVATFQQAGAKPPKRGDVTEGVGCEIGETPTTTPAGALTWGSAAERNRKLIPWRRAISMTFAERPRCLRVAWALDGLFNGKCGYAYPVNADLANMTGLPINKVQDALLALESDGAILRITRVTPGGRRQRLIYPATALLPTPAVGQAVTPTMGVGGHPQQMGVHNLTKRPRLPKTELERARLAANLRQERTASERGTVVGCPSSEATGDGKDTRLTEEATVGMSRSGSAPDDLRREAKGAAGHRPRDAGGIASDRSIAEEENEWTL